LAAAAGGAGNQINFFPNGLETCCGNPAGNLWKPMELTHGNFSAAVAEWSGSSASELINLKKEKKLPQTVLL